MIQQGCPSEPAVTFPPDARASESPFGTTSAVGDVRLRVGAASSREGEPMAEHRGRPRGVDSDARRQRFMALVASGVDFDVAADQARIDYRRALRLLSKPESRQLIAHADAA